MRADKRLTTPVESAAQKPEVLLDIPHCGTSKASILMRENWRTRSFEGNKKPELSSGFSAF